MSGNRDYRDFNQLVLLTQISGTLINETPLRTGVGRENVFGALVDAAVYRVNGIPIIPGSSLKGALRHLAEVVIASEGEEVHDPWNFEAMENEAKNGNFCTICGIFGSTQLASHIKIFDAKPLNPEGVKTFTRTGVAINREFGGAWGGLLYTEEFVTPGTEWSLRMEVINIKIFPEVDQSDKRAVLLRTLLNILMNPGISIGARKSIGCGLIRLRNLRWRVYKLQDGKFSLESEGGMEGSV